ncbi:unnamed protein product [Mytilus coruscus]|uniref:TRIM56 n=1 Tax=Mytilus coruscus TaxID=42192 RepID=A0A6J8C7P8_MYTCO|nr:unnamed protein product [Mytilus coruscus]
MATVGQIEQDVFICPVCLETLTSPKSLPCLHTFCETCIGEFIISTEQRAEQKLSNYPCPVCRTVVTPTNPEDKTSQWAASLPHNFTISSLMDNSESVKQECHLCKKRDKNSDATQWCRDCTEALCEECLQFHGLMKLFADHKIVQIENMDIFYSVDEPDSSMRSDLCPVHTSKVLEAFCFDHQDLCCVICLTLQHRKCEHVQAMEEMQNLKNHRINALVSEVNDIKVKVEKVMKEKNDEKEKLDTVFTEIEAEVNKFISSIKDKLDSLLALFIKGLNITQASSVLNTSLISEAKLVKSAKLDQVENIDGLIALESIKTIPVEMNKYIEQLFPSDSSVLSKTHPFSSFDSIILKYVKAIYLNGFDAYSGVFVSDEVIVVGGKVGKLIGKLKAINISDERIVDECPVLAKVKRLTFDFKSESLFVSCSGSKLYRLKFVNVFNSQMKIKVDNHRNGGICISDGLLYAIIYKTVQKLSLENVKQPLEKCFETNTSCKNLNGLEIDSKNNRLLHTSENSEVVCTSFDGREIFRHKDEHMKETKSVSVHSEGIIFAGDKTGPIHIISEDGRQRRTVLNSCDKLKKVRDLCFDKSGSRLAVFGRGYIELYDVCTGSG